MRRRALGTALEWPEAKEKAEQVRAWGIRVRSTTLSLYLHLSNLGQQLLEIWNKAKHKERDAMLWGDEASRQGRILGRPRR